MLYPKSYLLKSYRAHPLHPTYTPTFGLFHFAFLHFFHIFLSKLGMGTLISGFLGPRASFSSDRWPTGPLGDPTEPLQTFSKNAKNLKYFLRDAISLPWPSHESGPQSARRARKTGMKSPKHRLTTCLPRDAMNQNVKKCCPEPPQDFFRFGVR